MPLQIPRIHQARDLREEAGGSPAMGWRPSLQEEAQDAEQAETRHYGCG